MRDQHCRPAFCYRHPWLTGFAVALLVLFFPHVAATVPAALGAAALTVYVCRRGRALARRTAAVRARAEYEHRLNLAGDPRGVFGRYPPVQAGWFPDPGQRSRMRYFDGVMWTGYAAPR